jgi:hypothetical protein
MSELLSRDAVLGANDLAYDEVDVPQWGGKVRVRTLTGAERSKFELSITDVRLKGDPKLKLDDLRTKLVALCMVDAQGQRLFTDSRADLEALGKKNAAAIGIVYDAAAKLNGLDNGDVEELVGE